MSMTQPSDRGGYRKPEQPAVTSGPGALSARTDGSPTQPATYIPGLPFGEGRETYNTQTKAPMAGDQTKAIPQQEIIGLMEPSRRRDENVETGIATPNGAGPEIMAPLPNRQPTLTQTLEQMAKYDPSGDTELVLARLKDLGY